MQMRRVCILFLERLLYHADLRRVRRRNEDRMRYRLPRGNNTGCGCSVNVRTETTFCRYRADSHQPGESISEKKRIKNLL